VQSVLPRAKQQFTRGWTPLEDALGVCRGHSQTTEYDVVKREAWASTDLEWKTPSSGKKASRVDYMVLALAIRDAPPGQPVVMPGWKGETLTVSDDGEEEVEEDNPLAGARQVRTGGGRGCPVLRVCRPLTCTCTRIHFSTHFSTSTHTHTHTHAAHNVPGLHTVPPLTIPPRTRLAHPPRQPNKPAAQERAAGTAAFAEEGRLAALLGAAVQRNITLRNKLGLRAGEALSQTALLAWASAIKRVCGCVCVCVLCVCVCMCV
jgi:hypothetical protein